MTFVLLVTGLVLVALGGLGEWLPVAPSSIQTNTYSKSLSGFLIPNTWKFTFAGVTLIFLAVFVFKGRG